MKVCAHKPFCDYYCSISRDYFSKNEQFLKLEALDI